MGAQTKLRNVAPNIFSIINAVFFPLNKFVLVQMHRADSIRLQ